MKILTKTLMIALFATLSIFVVTGINTNKAVAQDNQDEQNSESQEEDQSEEVTEDENSNEAYRYTAQSGDSFSLMARKAIQTYGFDKEVNLSQEQIIAAETYLTQDAGSPILNEGQEVEIDTSDVEAAVKRAQDLSDEQEALWTVYVDGADFNTNNVGESQE